MKTAIYARVSTSHHNQNPEIQINELKSFCELKGWAVCYELVDHGYSGSTDNRPALKQLLQLVKDKEVEAVVVVKLDRLFRSLKHLVSTLEDFERLGTKFVAIKDNVDYSTPSGRLFVQILGSLGEFERSLLRERTMAGLDHARKNGKVFGRPRIHNKDEILKLHSEGLTYRQIQKRLNAPMGSIASVIKSARNTSKLRHD
jgi:DNA invertase Pin-like site-specific DNA recombinase